MEATETTVLDSVKAAFDFEVVKGPSTTLHKGQLIEHKGYYGLVKEFPDGRRAESLNVSTKSSRYVPHSTDDVVALVEAAGEAFDGIGEAKCTFRNAHHVCVSPSHDQRRAIFGTADNIFPRFMIRGGYDGRGFLANMGFYRDACDNLAMLRQVEGTSVSIRHGSGLREKMDDLIQTFSVLKQSWATLGDVIVELQNRELNMPEFLDQVYGQPDEDSKRSKTIHKNRTQAIFRRLSRERFRTGRHVMDTEFKVSAWEAYNAIQGYVQHDASRKGSPNDFDRVIAASNDQYVRKAEKITMELLAA